MNLIARIAVGVGAAVFAGCGTQQSQDGALPLGTREGAIHRKPAGYAVVYNFGEGSNDARIPAAALLRVGPLMYGTTESGGTDGAYPEGALINLKGKLYGTTFEGGSNGHYAVGSRNEIFTGTAWAKRDCLQSRR
jgi:hypothetical protein